MLAMFITTLELAKFGVAQSDVDVHFYQKAINDGKAVDSLETIDQQIDFLVGRGEGDEDSLITYLI